MKTAASTSTAMIAATPAGASLDAMRKGRALMLASVVFFIANTMVVRTLGDVWAIHPWITTVVRFVVGLSLVFLPGMPTGRPSLRRVTLHPLLIARGVLGGAGVFLYYHTVGLIGVGRATFINITYVVWGALLASLFLKERMRPSVVAGLALGMAGMALLTGVFTSGGRLSHGDLLALIGALLSAAVIVLIRKLGRTETVGSIFSAQCVWGLALSFAPAVRHWEIPTLAAGVVLVFSGLLAGGGQLTMTAAYRSLPVAEGSLFQLLLPLGTGIGGALVFRESYSLAEGFGAALIVASCLLTMHTRPRFTAGLPGSGTGRSGS